MFVHMYLCPLFRLGNNDVCTHVFMSPISCTCRQVPDAAGHGGHVDPGLRHHRQLHPQPQRRRAAKRQVSRAVIILLF